MLHSLTAGKSHTENDAAVGKTHTTPSRWWRVFKRDQLLVWIAPAVVYLAIRGISVVALWLLSATHGQKLADKLSSWDGQWYLNIARHGYDDVPAHMVDGFGHSSPETALAFFPGFPALTATFAWLPGIDVFGAAVTVSALSGVATAYALHHIGVHVGGSARVGLSLVALFAATPMGIVLSMTYAEALLCALCAWAVCGVLRRQWLLAGFCTLAAGLVRPTATALIVVVALAAIVEMVRRGVRPRPLLAVLLAPVGLLGYLGWVASRTGELGGYFHIQQRGWGAHFDGGVATARYVGNTVTHGTSIVEITTVAVLLATLVLLAVGMRMRLAWPLTLFAGLVLLLAVGSDGLMYAKMRWLLPAFPLLLPVALALAKRQRSTTLYLLAGIVVVSAWFGAHALTVWQYAI